MIDPALIIDAGLSHSGACLYAALAFLWFEHVHDVSKLRDLERRTGRKRFDPVVVTAEDLYAVTGLKKDGVAARVRELENAHPCIWRGCTVDHPLITVRRLGQGRGLQIRRFLCGDNPALPRRRVKAQRSAQSMQQSNELPGVTPAPEILQRSDARNVETVTTAQPATVAMVSALVPADIENAPLPCSEIEEPMDAQYAPVPRSRTGQRRSLEYGADAFREASIPRSLLGNTEMCRTIQKTTAASDVLDERAAADVIDKNETAERLVPHLLELARLNEPDYAVESARRIAKKLTTAALNAGFSADAAFVQISRGIADIRVRSATNPVAFLIRGVLGDRHNAAALDQFLLVPAAQSMAEKERSNLGHGDDFTRLPAGLQELILERVRAGVAFDGAWLRERGISKGAVFKAQSSVNSEQPVDSTTSPHCDALKRADPERYRSLLEAILKNVPVPQILGTLYTLDHPMVLGICRSRLERQLVDAAEEALAASDRTQRSSITFLENRPA